MAEGRGGEVFFRVRRVVDATAYGCASEDSLDELVLAEGFGEVVLVLLVYIKVLVVGATHVHLRRETLLTVTNHGVGSEGDNGGRWDTVLALPFANLPCSFETSLDDCQSTMVTVLVMHLP